MLASCVKGIDISLAGAVQRHDFDMVVAGCVAQVPRKVFECDIGVVNHNQTRGVGARGRESLQERALAKFVRLCCVAWVRLGSMILTRMFWSGR